MQYVVAPNKTVQVGKSMYAAGCIIPTGSLSDKEFEDLVKCGALRGGGLATLAIPAPKSKSPGKWNRDPRDLGDKSLDALNVMIFEIDPKQPAAASFEDALMLLSSEFDPNIDVPIKEKEIGTPAPWKGSPVQLTNGNMPAPARNAKLTEADSIPASERSEG